MENELSTAIAGFVGTVAIGTEFDTQIGADLKQMR